MGTSIPISVIGTVSSVIAAHYYSHSKLDGLFMESGAPGDAPEGNCETKCRKWLKLCNGDPDLDSLQILGELLQDYMEKESGPFDHGKEDLEEGRSRIKNSLAKNQLEYRANGYVVLAGSNLTSKSLGEYFRSGDYSSIEKEFDRAMTQINSDPHAAITAASSIIEAACKTYIETFNLEMPTKRTISPLWKTISQHLGLNVDRNLNKDQKNILQGLFSIVEGVGAFRTHIGSAHGRGIDPPKIVAAEARLAVSSAHTIVVFVMECWHARNA